MLIGSWILKELSELDFFFLKNGKPSSLGLKEYFQKIKFVSFKVTCQIPLTINFGFIFALKFTNFNF
jgi:hypothetical protein